MVTLAIERAAVWPPLADAPAEASPDIGFVPALLRRRCSPLTRMMLHVARAASPDPHGAPLPLVFASRYGESAATLTLLEALARQQPLTASGFSHSVHNTQAGIFAIATGNREAASAVAAGPDTFGAAFLEAIVVARRAAGRALLVIADEPLPPAFGRFQPTPPPAYAVALLLDTGRSGLEFSTAAGENDPGEPIPAALRFLHWLASSAPRLALGRAPAYVWTRAAAGVSAGSPTPMDRRAAPPASP